MQLLDSIAAAACSIVVGTTCCRSVGGVPKGRGACNMCTADVFISFHPPCVYSCSLCSSCCWVCVVAVLASVCCGQQIVHCRGLHLIEPRHVSSFFSCYCGCYDCCQQLWRLDLYGAQAARLPSVDSTVILSGSKALHLPCCSACRTSAVLCKTGACQPAVAPLFAAVAGRSSEPL